MTVLLILIIAAIVYLFAVYVQQDLVMNDNASLLVGIWKGVNEEYYFKSDGSFKYKDRTSDNFTEGTYKLITPHEIEINVSGTKTYLRITSLNTRQFVFDLDDEKNSHIGSKLPI